MEGVLEQIKPNIPSNCSYHIYNASFDETLTEVLNDIDEQNTSLAPSFVMIDPFGVSETPMKTINRILANPKSEVYISFMERDIVGSDHIRISHRILTIYLVVINGGMVAP